MNDETEKTQKENNYISIVFTVLFFIVNALCMGFCETVGASRGQAVLFSILTSVIIRGLLCGLFLLFIKGLEKITNKEVVI